MPEVNKLPVSDNLFERTSFVLNTEFLLKTLEGNSKLSPFKDLIIDFFIEVIPRLSRIELVADKTNTSKEVLYFEKDENGDELPPVSFYQLAMGMRSIIGLFGDMIQRLSKNRTFITSEKPTIFDIPKNPLKSLSDLQGIVLIDEFDNHLHPKWQRELVKKLSDLFPKVQFIVSTHSPIPFLGAPKNSIFIKVDRDKEHGIRVKKLDIDISTLSPNSILTSPIFGFGSLTPEMHDGSKPVKTNSDFQKIIEDEKLDKEIEKFLTDERKKRFNNLLNSNKK